MSPVRHLLLLLLACCGRLEHILQGIATEPQDISMWRELFSFGQSVLAKPARGGRRHNLTGIIKKRASAGSDQASESSQPQRFNYKPSRDEDASLAAAATAKIEDGNLPVAIRLLCSDEKMAVDSQPNLESYKRSTLQPPLTVVPFRVLILR